MKILKFCIAFSLLFTVCKGFAQVIVPSAEGIVFVNKNVTGGTADGSSWTNAVKELADALVAAHSNTGITQIWVANGTYSPLYSPEDGNFGTNDGSNNTFLLENNVQLYGGFAGTETILSLRDSLNSNTVLDGQNKCYHVVMSIGNTGSVMLNGFIIMGGNATGSGELVVNGQHVLQNYAGGVYNYISSLNISNCIFIGN
ncbi:MAG: hypothetical protein LBE82_08070, partial [Chitinophagaceae bacterium]|nr:hypothetical protein [Chitinophagaceae bacterium]